MRKIWLFIILLLIALFFFKQKDMTFKQTVLKALYPVIMFLGKVFPSKNAVLANEKEILPLQSFYDLKAIANNGDTIHFDQFRGKKVLIVNTASDCGYTGQYDELEKLYQQHKEKLVILGFPANDFKEQEKRGDQEIAVFCKINYGVQFPLMKKSHVIKGPGQHEVFAWLTDAQFNGWCNQPPTWNFSKYLVNEKGVLIRFFAQTVSPLDQKLVKEL